MKCPVCEVPLIVVERLQIELDYCIACKGFWFDAGELAMLIEALGLTSEFPDVMEIPPAEEKTREHNRRCPRCDKKMDKVRFGTSPPVLVDRCRQGHGLWFDKSELGLILDQHKSDQKHPVVTFLGEMFQPRSGDA